MDGVFSMQGRIFVGTAITGTDGAGGTELLGVRDERVTLITGQRSVTEYLNNTKNSYRDIDAETLVVMDLLEMTALALKLMFPGLTADGARFGPDLGTKIGQEHPKYNLLVVPKDTTNDYRLFCKAVCIFTESKDSIKWSPTEPWVEGDDLILEADGDEGDSEPPWRLETAAQLASTYAALSVP